VRSAKFGFAESSILGLYGAVGSSAYQKKAECELLPV
jgi:hypothetical protein